MEEFTISEWPTNKEKALFHVFNQFTEEIAFGISRKDKASSRPLVPQ